jgi:hypothetical protein
MKKTKVKVVRLPTKSDVLEVLQEQIQIFRNSHWPLTVDDWPEEDRFAILCLKRAKEIVRRKM